MKLTNIKENVLSLVRLIAVLIAVIFSRPNRKPMLVLVQLEIWLDQIKHWLQAFPPDYKINNDRSNESKSLKLNWRAR